jgi:hypothetical protein
MAEYVKIAMNTTSSLFRRPLMYTVLSDSAPVLHWERSLSVAIIPRGNGQLVSPLINELMKINPYEILLFNSKMLVQTGPISVRNIWVDNNLSEGELINITIEEAKGRSVLILWSDMRLCSGDISSNVFMRIEERGDLCTVPQFLSSDELKLPSLTAPAFDNKGFSVVRTMNNNGEIDSFFPLDYVGIYNRARFLNMGGYDTTITNSYWQRADFALRSALWGERIVLNPALTVAYGDDDRPIDDESYDLSCRIFALKNLGLMLTPRGARLPKRRLLWLLNSPKPLVLFSESYDWVHQNRFRFKYTAEEVVDRWGR